MSIFCAGFSPQFRDFNSVIIATHFKKLTGVIVRN